MTFQIVFGYLGLGLVFGATGQAVRVVVGVKKTWDEARAKQAGFSEVFSWSELFFSLLIGVVAGVLASLTVWDQLANITKETVMGLMAAGYAGAGFIEGFI